MIRAKLKALFRKHPALTGAGLACAIGYALHAVGMDVTALLWLSLALVSFADAWDEETMR